MEANKCIKSFAILVCCCFCSLLLLLHQPLICAADPTAAFKPATAAVTTSAGPCHWTLATCQDNCGPGRSAVLVVARQGHCPDCMCSSDAATTVSPAAATASAADDASSLLSQLANQLRNTLGALDKRQQASATSPLAKVPSPTISTPAPPPPTGRRACQWFRGCGLACPELGYRRESTDGCQLCQCIGGPDEACNCRCSAGQPQWGGQGVEIACACDCTRTEDGKRISVREASKQRIGGASDF